MCYIYFSFSIPGIMYCLNFESPTKKKKKKKKLMWSCEIL